MIQFSLATITSIWSRIIKYSLLTVTLLLFAFSASSQSQTISLSFTNGFLGTQGNNSNSTTGNKTFSELGISRASFSQVDVNGDGKFGDGGTQGNDLAGTVKFYFTSGQTLTLNGAINFTNNGNTRDIFGFIFDPGANTTFTYGANQTYTIVKGTTSGTSTSLGLKAYSSNYNITSTFGGNASTSGALDALNLELANTPQPSTVILSNSSVTEGQNLVYNVTLTSAPSGSSQVFTFSSSGTSSSTVDYNATYTFSNSVVDNGDGTITVPVGVSSFTITVATIDDAPIESTETLILSIGSKSATGNILDNDAVPTINTTGSLTTFTTCASTNSTAQTFTVSAQYLTSNLVLSAPSGYEISATSNGTYNSTLSITPISGEVSSRLIYVRTSTNTVNGQSGNVVITSTGAITKNVATGNAVINPQPSFSSTPILSVRAREQYLYSISGTTTSNNAITFSDPTNSVPSWLSLSLNAQTNGQQIGSDISGPGAVTGDLNGNIYVIQNSGTGIYKITPDGTTTLYAQKTISAYTYGGALVIGHYLYISYYNGSYGMAQYDLNSNAPIGINMLPGVSMLSLTYYNGNIYGAGYSTQKVFKITLNENNPASSTSSDYITSGLNGPFGLAFNSSGELFVAQYGGRNLLKFATNSTTSPTAVLATGSTSLTDTKIDANGNVYISYYGQRIRKYQSDFSSYIEVSGANTTYVWGMSINSNGTLFYGDNSYNKVYTLQTNARLFGNPQTVQVGQWPISLDAYDQVCHATQNFTINVLPNVPMPVTSQTATAGDGSATINFTPPTDNGGATVTSYTVVSSSGNFSATSSSGPITITGLTNGTSYTFTIYATNSVGNSTSVVTGTVVPQPPPTITTIGPLPVIASCSGCTVNSPSFKVSGSYLTNNIVLTAPTGVLISTSTSGTYSTSITLTQSSGSVTNTSIFVKLSNNATTNNSGAINITSTGAASKTMSVTVNTDNALNFDGVNDYIRLSSNVPYTNNAITIDAWIRTTSNSRLDDIISWGNTTIGVNVVEFRLADGKLDFILNDGSRFYQKTSTALINTGKWVHVAVVKSGTNVTLYIDGQVANATSPAGVNSSAAPVPNVTNIGILGYNSSSTNANGYGIISDSYFPGDIDQIRIWNTAKDANAILANMNTTMSGSETDLVASFDFNQGIANGTNGTLTVLNNINSSTYTGTLSNFNLTGTTSNFVPGFIPSITGTATANVGASSTLSNTLTGGTWSSANTSVATVNSSTGVVTGVAGGTSTITYTICDKTVNTVFTVTVPTITTTGTLTAFSTCSTTNSSAQTFTVSAQNLTANLVLTAPSGYEIATSSGGTYSSTISLVPSSGSVSATLIYVRTTTSAVNGQSGNIVITSTGATTKNVATGNAVITQNKTASVTITSNATNNTICSGTSITFTANATNGGSTPTYQWYKDNVVISGATGSTYTTSALSSNATITVVMGSSISSCLSGSPATSNAINVIVNSVPNNPGVISGASTICLNANQVYSIPAVTGATSYTWIVTGNLSATNSSTSNILNITAANSAGSGTITVYANNACGTSVNSSTLSVSVNNTPAPTASFTVSASEVCLSNAGVTFTSTSTPNATISATITSYAWDFGDGNTASSATASNTYTISGSFDAYLTIQASNNCTSVVSSRITVSPLSVAGTASAANATICEGSNTSVSLTGYTGNIQWQSSIDVTNWSNVTGATSANLTTGNLTATTYYRAVVTSGACSSATSGVVTVTVSPTPTATLASVANLFTTSTSFDLGYSNAVGSPDEYSITAVAPNAMPNFTNISNYGLLGSPITVSIPASTSGTYNFNLTLRNNTVGCTSANIPFTVSVAVQPPSSLSYTTPNVYTVGSSISALNPSSTGGAITQYTIGPSLPAGLTIDPTTGVISGTPTAASSQTSYTVTGTNSSGTVTATVVITVNVAPPSSLSYTTPNVYTVGTTISALNPTSTGGAITQFTIAPSLPAGLTINPTTGVISGTPTSVSSQTSYTVTGTNASGTVTATVVITVNVAAPASLSYNTPNVYTLGGGAITALNPTSTGGTITQYTIGPSLPAGLSINPTTGVISGTPTAASGQTTYTVTGTNSTGSVTATIVITVNAAVQNNTLPQGGISAVDYKLFASDTVKLKVDITAGTSPYTLIISNNKTSVKDTISSVTNGAILNLKSTSSNTIYTLFKITDNGGSVRSSGFTKDTTGVTIVAPNIALTLKADKAVKQPDNSFKTKLLLKIKNSGQIDLKNVQVNANLSEVFPKDLNYKLDSVKLVNGNIRLSSNYQGNGTSTSASSVKKGITASAGIVSNAVLDANYLFDNGVNLAINEEADVDFYLSIAPTTSSVVLKLQFSSAGDGVLPKSGGYISQQSSTAVSDDGTNLATHPNNTNIGTPNPTYLPLFPVEVIGAALKASNPTPVTGGYTFDFIAKAKSLSNMNLDTVAIFNDFSKTFTSPDTAYIVGSPVIIGSAVFNTNFNGYSNTLLIDSTAQLAVGDSITVSYTLFVGTNKTSGSWSNSITASGHSSVDYNYVWDISTDGTNPDPNGDGDTKEEGKTYFYINYTPPAPPKVENKTYVFGTPIPSTIENLVKEKPSGTIPVWCDVQTAICSPNAPATPTIIGKYYYQLKSYDTTTKLYSIAYVNDTVIIKPPVPIVNDSTYIIGVANNPFNVSVQVKAMTGGTLKYFLKTILLNAVPALGNTPSVVSYTVSQVVNSIESDTASFKVTLLHPNDVMHLQKIAGEAVLQSNSSFNIPFTFIARNVLNKQLDSVLITDNLMNSIASPGTFSVVSLSGTGGLVTNTNFNGKTDINVTTYASKLIANAIDTIKLVINVIPNGYSGILQNTAILNAKTPYGKLSMNSSSKAWSSSDISKTPTPYTIPDLRIDIPEGFSPNRDGVNDRFVIIKPYGTILELEVFNRWGNIVYTNPNYNNEWDGRGTNNFLGQELLDGGYYYTLKAKSPNGNVQIFKGFVLIQR